MGNRRYIIHKGIAGLGNRLQVLGRCLDIAQKTGAVLIPDWRDTSFQDDFFQYFSISGIKTAPVSDIPVIPEDYKVLPMEWKNNLEIPCAKKHFKNSFPRCSLIVSSSDWDVLAVCDYQAQHSDLIFDILHPSSEILEKVSNTLNSADAYIWGDLSVWHIRHTDKKGPDPDELLKKMKSSSDPVKILITDNREIAEKAKEIGIYCCSEIPSVPSKGGVHHSSVKYLEQNGLTRKQLNVSAIADLYIGICAGKFYSTCENSSFSNFISRARRYYAEKSVKN